MSLSRGTMEVDFSLSDDYQMTGTYQVSQWEWEHIMIRLVKYKS